MRGDKMKWFIKFNDGETFESESMMETNKKAIEKQYDVSIMEVKHLDRLWKVDYGTGNIYCNGETVFKSQENVKCRWVSHRDVVGQVGTNIPAKILGKTYFFGWQGTRDGVNIKRLITIDQVGNVKIIIKPEE